MQRPAARGGVRGRSREGVEPALERGRERQALEVDVAVAEEGLEATGREGDVAVVVDGLKRHAGELVLEERDDGLGVAHRLLLRREQLLAQPAVGELAGEEGRRQRREDGVVLAGGFELYGAAGAAGGVRAVEPDAVD